MEISLKKLCYIYKRPEFNDDDDNENGKYFFCTSDSIKKINIRNVHYYAFGICITPVKIYVIYEKLFSISKNVILLIPKYENHIPLIFNKLEEYNLKYLYEHIKKITIYIPFHNICKNLSINLEYPYAFKLNDICDIIRNSYLQENFEVMPGKYNFYTSNNIRKINEFNCEKNSIGFLLSLVYPYNIYIVKESKFSYSNNMILIIPHNENDLVFVIYIVKYKLPKFISAKKLKNIDVIYPNDYFLYNLI